MQTRDLGVGILEMTYVVHSFIDRDDIVFVHLYAPWGGTRFTSPPFHYLSTPGGELLNRTAMQEQRLQNGVDVCETGDWNLSNVTNVPDSPSLALVFGRDRHPERELAKVASGKPCCQFAGSIYRDWPAMDFRWRTQDFRERPLNSHRNYEIAVVTPKCRLAPGVTNWHRSFLVETVATAPSNSPPPSSIKPTMDYGSSLPRPHHRCRCTSWTTG